MTITTKKELLEQELRNCRTVIGELLDKAWELGGYSVGENEFEGYSLVKLAREELKDIEKFLNQS